MDNSQLMLIKKEVINTMATRGWHFVNERAAAVITKMSSDAIDCEDKQKSETLVTEARAAKKFWNQLVQSLQVSTQVDAESTSDDGEEAAEGDEWYEVVID